MEKKRLFYAGYWGKDELIKNKLIIDKIEAGKRMFDGDFYIIYHNDSNICAMADIDANVTYGMKQSDDFFKYYREEQVLGSVKVYTRHEEVCDNYSCRLDTRPTNKG